MNVTPKHIVEYGAIRFFSTLFRLLPYRAALGLAWGLAAFLHFVARFRVAEARRRIREVFGDKRSEKEVKAIAWRSFRNLCFNVVEIVRLPYTGRAWIDRYVDMPSPAEVEAAAGGPGGMVIATMHMGNWDVLGVVAHMLGYPIFFLARGQKNPLTDRHLNRMRGITGVRTLLVSDTVARDIIKQLRAGKWLAILPDVRYRFPALTVPFLGKPANLAEGTALFARQINRPIVPIVARRKNWTEHSATIGAPIVPDPECDKQEDIARMMRELMDAFGAMIREEPEQYFWYNKRWVLEPLEPEA